MMIAWFARQSEKPLESNYLSSLLDKMVKCSSSGHFVAIHLQVLHDFLGLY